MGLPGPKTDRHHLMKDYLGRYCSKTFETAKGKKEKGCCWELNQGPPTAIPFSPDGTTFLSVSTCVVCVCVPAYMHLQVQLFRLLCNCPYHIIITVVHSLMLLNWLSCTACRFPFNVPPPPSFAGLCCSA